MCSKQYYYEASTNACQVCGGAVSMVAVLRQWAPVFVVLLLLFCLWLSRRHNKFVKEEEAKIEEQRQAVQRTKDHLAKLSAEKDLQTVGSGSTIAGAAGARPEESKDGGQARAQEEDVKGEGVGTAAPEEEATGPRPAVGAETPAAAHHPAAHGSAAPDPAAPDPAASLPATTGSAALVLPPLDAIATTRRPGTTFKSAGARVLKAERMVRGITETLHAQQLDQPFSIADQYTRFRDSYANKSKIVIVCVERDGGRGGKGGAGARGRGRISGERRGAKVERSLRLIGATSVVVVVGHPLIPPFPNPFLSRYFQLIGSLTFNLDVSLPHMFAGLLSITNMFNLGLFEILPLSCQFGSNYRTTLLGYVLTPIAVAVLVFLVSCVLPKLKSRCFDVFLLVTYLCLPSCSSAIFHVWTCESFDEIDAAYLTVDYQINCGSAEYRSLELLAGVFVLVFPIGIPAM